MFSSCIKKFGDARRCWACQRYRPARLSSETVSWPASIFACSESIRVRAAAGIRCASDGFSTSMTTCDDSPSSNDPRLERSRLELFGDREKGERQVDDHAAERDVRRNAILIGVRSDDERVLFFSRGLKYAEAGRISILEYDIHAVRDLRERLLLAGADVVPVSDV